MEDMIVQDDVGDDDESENAETVETADAESAKAEEKMDVDEKANRKRESKDEDEASKPKKPCLDKDTKAEEDNKALENNDAEDSINLDLGEDELLNEEVCYYVFSVTVKLPSVSTKVTNGFVELMEID